MAKNTHTQPKAHPQLKTAAASTSRPEGTMIEAQVQTRIGVSGITEISLGFDLNKAPAPTRRYFADVASIEQTKSWIKVSFAQRRIGGGFRSMVALQLTNAATKVFLTSVQQLSPSIETIAQQANIEPEPMSVIDAEPVQVIEAVANFFAAAMAGEEACIDFYHASAFAMRSVVTDRKLGVEPVVRIDLRFGMLLGVVNKLRELAA